ncbi:DUF3631 domain-containing protein [Kribbella sp. NPDC004536]|uniref:DUF3631 domain-containing protein n=1 Tax=Kribbella sp. NPDC004536 TaxID=3364106 RepID=UPI00367F1D34
MLIDEADPETPWATIGKDGLTGMKLGNLLREFEIRSATIQFPTGQAKGYFRRDFTDAFHRWYGLGPRAVPDLFDADDIHSRETA